MSIVTIAFLVKKKTGYENWTKVVITEAFYEIEVPISEWYNVMGW